MRNKLLGSLLGRDGSRTRPRNTQAIESQAKTSTRVLQKFAAGPSRTQLITLQNPFKNCQAKPRPRSHSTSLRTLHPPACIPEAANPSLGSHSTLVEFRVLGHVTSKPRIPKSKRKQIYYTLPPTSLPSPSKSPPP